ncbi:MULTISPECIES: YaaR family protein [unclassified Bacillus (in: firmicutes)]|uniref:YaaR family protein n=1 Tax=unclassified Bacillus (in: firmicutes) TaxID=185979 RepID=UPI00080ADDEC|nr:MULTISPECIES: YaaR family protein [unclassified Bacillus (in: firmicutes)]OCA84686.1 hypothetical protein A8L44_09820 [Bacillus sp. FJAT-27986]
MEVQRVGRTGLQKVSSKEEVAKDSIAFKEVMGTRRNDLTLERLTRKMQEIEEQGKRLGETQSVDHLRKYKKLVKEFLDDAVKNGLQLEEHRGFNHRGSAKVYKLVKEVDKKLVDLTNAVLDKEDKRIHLLGMIGEIQGMLINIYT